jgi:copper(I)-binding protein
MSTLHRLSFLAALAAAKLATLALFVAAAEPARAQAAAPAVQVQDGWARATAAGQPVGAGYLRLVGGAAGDRLLGASSPVAGRVELHSMGMDGGVMRMREVDGIDVPAGGAVVLEPGGLHLMLMDLKAPLQPGKAVPLTLRFQKAGEVQATLQVRATGAAAKPADKAHHGDHHKH